MRKVISFDFDGVLHRSVIQGTTDPINYDQPKSWSPFKESFDIIFKEALKGNKIVIVSKRMESMNLFIAEFVDIHKLPVSEIHCTNCQSKYHKLKNLKVDTHYDDCEDLIEELEGSGISFVLVNPFTKEFKKYY